MNSNGSKDKTRFYTPTYYQAALLTGPRNDWIGSKNINDNKTSLSLSTNTTLVANRRSPYLPTT